MNTNTEIEKRYRLRDERRNRQERIYSALAKQSPADRFQVARAILAQLAEEGCSYADFQAAQAVQREVRQGEQAAEVLATMEDYFTNNWF